MYDGFWRSGKKHGLGVFRPALDDSQSRRHSNSHGWQPAQAGSGQQQAGSGGGGLSPATAAADSSPDLQALERFHAQEGQTAAPAAVDHDLDSAAVEAPVDSPPPKPRLKQPVPPAAEQCSSCHQQPEQHTPKHTKQKTQVTAHASPFEAAAAVLNSENSVVLPATALTKGHSWKPALAPVDSFSPVPAAPRSNTAEAAVAMQPVQHHRSMLATAAADADAPSSSPATTSGPGATVGGGEAAVAVPAGQMATAPRKLFVREYDMGQLLREYPLTAEEIKMIFGFLWPKNKVCKQPVCGSMCIAVSTMTYRVSGCLNLICRVAPCVAACDLDCNNSG